MMTSPEKANWLNERMGFLTASNMRKAMSYLKNGAPAKERHDLQWEILAERASGENMYHVVTPAMEHGLKFEDEAVEVFRSITGRDPKVSHFYKHAEIEYFGATPDRELDDGLLEVKCPTTQKFLRWKIEGKVPEEHHPQLLAQLACTGRKWCGFVAYDPRIKDERKRLFMAKFEPTAEQIAEVEAEARKFLDELDTMWEIYKDHAA